EGKDRHIGVVVKSHTRADHPQIFFGTAIERQLQNAALPLLSIIVVGYNGCRYLEKCLAALQDDVTDGTEIIVVDNASTDGSADLVAVRFPTVRLIRNETNRGFAAACNQGAHVAKGDILVFLNQDTEVTQGWLLSLIEPLAQSNIGLTTSKVLQMGRPGRIHLCGQDVHYTGLVFSRGFQDPVEYLLDAKIINAVSGASFAVRRKLWEALGGFDETFYMYYEETDLSWRAQLQGYNSYYVPASMVLHDYQEVGPGYNQLYHSMRNRVLMNLKNWQWPTLLLLAPGLLLAEVIEWFLAWRCGQPGLRAKLHTLGWLLTHPQVILRVRRCVQSNRSVSDAEILKTRTYRLNPVTVTGGVLGRSITRLCNGLFAINYRLACTLCDALNL
ncbi:MAG: glycosyltransferase family 2 protein, partial [Anaerolineae bacterium]|nr:glycosyltransferase family 2 protein [Anaerolineae bacterium]